MTVFSDENIYFQVIADTLTSRGGTFRLRNFSDTNLYYGEDYEIKKKKGSTYIDIDVQADFPAPLYTLCGNAESDINFDWSSIYGELESGIYVLIKRIKHNDSVGNIYCEFELN